MTVSGVRSSWLTSASSRRRDASFSSRRALIALNARASERTSAGPRTFTWVTDLARLDAPGRVDEIADRRRGASDEASQRAERRMTKISERQERRERRWTDWPPNRLVDDADQERDQEREDQGDDEEEAPPARHHEAVAASAGPHSRSAAMARPPATIGAGRPSGGPHPRPRHRSWRFVRHRPADSRRRRRSAGSAARAAPARSCGARS